MLLQFIPSGALGDASFEGGGNARNQATQRLFPKWGYALAGEIALGFRLGLNDAGIDHHVPILPVLE